MRRLLIILSHQGILLLALARPAWAQVATSSASPSALPEAGSAGTTIFLAIFGVALIVIGALVSLRAARQVA